LFIIFPFILTIFQDFNNKNNMRMSYPPTEGLTSPEIEIAESGTMLDSKGYKFKLNLLIYSIKSGNLMI
jgi:hypothetical protein